MRKRDRILAGIAACMLVTGCGAAGGTKNIDLGIQAVENTDYAGALEYFDQALEQKEDAMELYRGYGLAYMGMSEYGQAVTALEQSLQCSDGRLSEYEYDINYYLATAYFKENRLVDAVEVYDAIIALRPKEKDAYYLRGVAKLANGEYDTAVADFDKAIDLDRNDYSIYINIYTTLREYGHEKEGLAYLQGVMDTETTKMSNYDKGRICYYLGDYTNACTYLEQAYNAAPGEESMLFLGRSYEADGNLNYAVTLYTKYLQENPQSAAVYNQLGLCKLDQGEYSAALEAFETAMQLEDNGMFQTLKFNEIVAYEYLGDYRKATVLIESYLTSYPDDEVAKREYIFLQTR